MEVPNNETFASGISTTVYSPLKSQFTFQMDQLLANAGTIVLDLQPMTSDCPSPCVYNPVLEVNTIEGRPCSLCGGRGAIHEPRTTTYRAHKRWTSEPFENADQRGEAIVGGRIAQNYCRTKTVLESMDHLRQCIGATIDGHKVELIREPSNVGFLGTQDYVVSWWKKQSK